MSHGPFGLGGAALAPGPACWAIVNAAPISVSASVSIRANLVLVFMFILLSAFPELIVTACYISCKGELGQAIVADRPASASQALVHEPHFRGTCTPLFRLVLLRVYGRYILVLWRNAKIHSMPVPVLNGTKPTRTRTGSGIESAPKRLRTCSSTSPWWCAAISATPGGRKGTTPLGRPAAG